MNMTPQKRHFTTILAYKCFKLYFLSTGTMFGAGVSSMEPNQGWNFWETKLHSHLISTTGPSFGTL